MSALALAPPDDLRELAEASMSPDEAAYYLQYSLRLPFGRSKLAEARAGECDGPPFERIGRRVVYFKADLDAFARAQFPSRFLINPWHEH